MPDQSRIHSRAHRRDDGVGHAHPRERCLRRHAGGTRARSRTPCRRPGIVPDDVARIVDQLVAWIADPEIDVIISTGGTGLTGRDVTPEAFRSVFEKEIDGFSAIFHRISYDKIGTSTIQSRACAGVAKGTYLFALPGSPGAVKDGWDGILKAPARLPPQALQFHRDHAAAGRTPAPQIGRRFRVRPAKFSRTALSPAAPPGGAPPGALCAVTGTACRGRPSSAHRGNSLPDCCNGTKLAPVGPSGGGGNSLPAAGHNRVRV